MNVIEPGHSYELYNFEQNIPELNQVIHFINKVQVGSGPELKTIRDGTTNEEVLLMLIDRLQYLYDKFPSRETAIAKTKIEESLMWLEKRTRDRKSRGVEGKALA